MSLTRSLLFSFQKEEKKTHSSEASLFLKFLFLKLHEWTSNIWLYFFKFSHAANIIGEESFNFIARANEFFVRSENAQCLSQLIDSIQYGSFLLLSKQFIKRKIIVVRFSFSRKVARFWNVNNSLRGGVLLFADIYSRVSPRKNRPRHIVHI
jgi:hypothetical protein